MTYFYYKTSTLQPAKPVVTDEKIAEWKHLAEKKNWRITQLPNGYYQTEVNNPNDPEKWVDITRRETLDGAEAAIEALNGTEVDGRELVVNESRPKDKS